MAVTAQERKLLLDGEWIETGEWQDVDSPYSGETVARVARAGAEHTRKALDAAERAMSSPLPAHERAAILDGPGDAVGGERVRLEACVAVDGRVREDGHRRRVLEQAGDVAHARRRQ